MIQIPEILIIQSFKKPLGKFETLNDQHKIECPTVVPPDTVSNHREASAVPGTGAHYPAMSHYCHHLPFSVDSVLLTSENMQHVQRSTLI